MSHLHDAICPLTIISFCYLLLWEPSETGYRLYQELYNHTEKEIPHPNYGERNKMFQSETLEWGREDVGKVSHRGYDD